MASLRSLLLVACGLAASTSPAQAAPDVVASIKPLHSLVAGVMRGVGEPGLVVGDNQSPHSFSLRPSAARSLEGADLIFWVGPDLETFLERPLATLGRNARIVALMDLPEIRHVTMRAGGAFEGHDHHDDDQGDGHNDDDDHAGDDDHRHDHDHGRHDDHAEEHHGDETPRDGHIWLDPANANVMVREIEKALSAADPDNARRYAANAAAMNARIDGLFDEIDSRLAPVRQRPFIVFHDAYQQLERRFGLRAAGSLTVNPDRAPGAERLAEIRSRVRELGVVCVFSEPQFQPNIVTVVTEGTGARTGILDPLGAEIPAGPGLYVALMRNMAASMRACLSPSG